MAGQCGVDGEVVGDGERAGQGDVAAVGHQIVIGEDVAHRVIGGVVGALDQRQLWGLDGVDGDLVLVGGDRVAFEFAGAGGGVGDRTGVEVGLVDGVGAVQVTEAPGARLVGMAGQAASRAMSSEMVNGPVRVTLPLLVTR